MIWWNQKERSIQPTAIKPMASAMKELMDIFHAETALDDGDYERRFVFEAAVSLTNNCHQKSPAEIKEYLTTAFTSNRSRDTTEEARVAWDDALLLLDIYFNAS